MKKSFTFTVFILMLLATVSAQQQNSYTEKWQHLKDNDHLTYGTKFRLKTTKTGKQELYIKFINKSKKALAVESKFGIYDNGILEETSEVNPCLKKSHFDNWFRRSHIIESEALQSKDIEVKLIEFKASIIDECRETDR